MGYRFRSVVQSSAPYRDAGPSLQDRAPPPARPASEVASALRSIPIVRRFDEEGPRLVLHGDGEETIRVHLASAGDVTAAELEVDGNSDRLALHVANALVPLYGPLELRLGDQHGGVLVDGTEPIEALVTRHHDDLRARLEALRGIMADVSRVMTPLTKRADAVAAHRNKELWKVGAIVATCAVGLGGYWLFGEWLPRAPLGETCTKAGDCRSAECLPREASRELVIGKVTIPDYTLTPASPEGVCTAECSTDTDCSASMRCEEVERRTGISNVALSRERVRRCVPRSWGDPR